MIKLCVLTGGDSSEREAALMGGEQVMKHLDRDKYDIKRIDLPADGGDRAWVSELINFNPDISFFALLGGCGENGSLQGMFETLHLKYCGSGPLASAIGMDKTTQRFILNANGIKTTEGELVPRGTPLETIETLVDKYGLPCVIKPNAGGSSLGVTILKDKSGLKKALDLVWDLNDEVVIEKYVRGREMTTGIVETEEGIVALRPIDIKVATEFYDYNAKYFDDRTTLDLIDDSESDLAEKLKEVSIKVFRALNCAGYGRVDVLVDDSGEIHVLEINTLPGMTSHSLLPKAASQFWTYSELLDIIIDYALAQKKLTKVAHGAQTKNANH